MVFWGNRTEGQFQREARGLCNFLILITWRPGAVQEREISIFFVMELLQWITPVGFRRPSFMVTYQVLTRWLMTSLSITQNLKTAYDVISYKHKPRLQTTLELLNATKEVEGLLARKGASPVSTFSLN
ncbi:hypothetical protein H5410_008818 [Solanum commersonii]|uniref:Uncharacterized protein n=1 Tax=Solanum commersonii TaxID=4109 RepID=A0A9J6AG97_SOLCO|nr:hypothetical protein H5410_008818 [Solanum commersonii]